MSEQVCDDCELRKFKTSTYIAHIDTIRVQLDNPVDKADLQLLPDVALVEAALMAPRPERCAQLAELVERPKASKRAMKVDRCPEIALVGRLIVATNCTDYPY